MARTIYQNNDVEITIEPQDEYESKIDVNGENLIWISNDESNDFKIELSNLLDKYRI